MRLPMNLVQRVKSIFSERAIEEFYYQIFKTIFQEMEEQSREGSQGFYVPNFYRVLVPIKYKESIEKLDNNVIDKLKDDLETKIRKKKFKIRSGLEINFILTDSIDRLIVRGDFIFKASDVEQTKGGQTKVFNGKNFSSNKEREIDSTVKIKSLSQYNACLKLITQDKLLKEFKIDSIETNLGRQKSNEIPIPDPNVSRVHAQIINKRYYYIIRDLNSTNGVIVNGELIREKRLKDEDEIILGETKLEFSLES